MIYHDIFKKNITIICHDILVVFINDISKLFSIVLRESFKKRENKEEKNIKNFMKKG